MDEFILSNPASDPPMGALRTELDGWLPFKFLQVKNTNFCHSLDVLGILLLAVKFPVLEANHADGRSLKLSISSHGNEAGTRKLGITENIQDINPQNMIIHLRSHHGGCQSGGSKRWNRFCSFCIRWPSGRCTG